MRLASSSVCAAILLSALACDEPRAPAAGPPDAGPPWDAALPDAGDPEPDAGAVVADAGPASGAEAGPPVSDQLAALYEDVLVVRCGGPLCHGPGVNENTYYGFRPALQMPDPATARAVLVDRRVECMSSGDDRIRVVPFDPEASAILTVAEDGLCGRRHNVVVGALTPDELAAIERWIAAGAP
ncbi:MAG: hypothetical protein KF729_03495 [Sandaracinaceae bacterium]|nr:hypothetical protein [Sandaracinaceae bacterium]